MEPIQFMERIATTSPYPYGRIRIWGTIGYALGSQLAGFIYDFVSPSAIFITFVLTMDDFYYWITWNKCSYRKSQKKQKLKIRVKVSSKQYSQIKSIYIIYLFQQSFLELPIWDIHLHQLIFNQWG